MRIAHVLLSLSLAGSWSPAFAAAAARPDTPPTKQPITARDLVGMKLASSLAVSPDGRSVLFVVDDPDFERSRVNHDVYLARLGGDPKDVRRLTYTPDSDEEEPRFSPDGRAIAFVSDRPVPKPGEEPKSGGDDEPKKQVWVMPVDGGEARPLTEAEEGVFHFDWAPDSKSIVFTAREVLPKAESEAKDAEKKEKRDAKVEDKERYRHEFWTVDVESGKARRISAGDLGVDAFRVSPDGKWLVYESNLTGRPDDSLKTNLYLMALPGGATRALTTAGGVGGGEQWSPDGRRVAYVAYSDPRYEYTRVDAFVVDVAAASNAPAVAPAAVGGAPPATAAAPVNLTKQFDRSVASVAWEPDGRHLVGVVVDGVNQPLFRFDAGAPGTPAPAQSSAKPQRLAQHGTFATEVAVAANGAVAYVDESATEAPDLYAAATVDGAASRLTDLNPDMREREIARQEVIRWKGPKGLDVEGVLTYPLGYKAGTRVPLVLAIHGGPFGVSESTLKGGYYHEQMWAAEGYAVLQPNYRGSDGYGDAFAIANRGDLGGDDFRDIMAGVDRVVAMGVADPDRLGVMGLSYGGYMTDWIISQTSRFKGAISESGIFNLVTDYSNSDYPSWEPGYLNGFYWEKGNLELYLERSAFTRADRITTPVLILHGDDDNNTFVSNSKEMYQALKALGRTVEFVRFPREGHGFDEPNHRLDEAARWVAWMNRYVRAETLASRARFVEGDYAPAGDWEYTVAAVDAEPEYSGMKAAGRFVEVTILVRGTPGKSTPASVAVGDVALVLADGRTLRPLGVVVAGGGARAVATGDVRLHLATNPEAARSYVPLVVAFDVPEDAARATVRLGSYAPFLVDVSK